MDLFETMRTVFKVLASVLTQNRLIFIGAIALFLFVAWCVLACLFNSFVRFNKTALDVIDFVKKNEIDRESYPKFVNIYKNFPNELCFAWKKYEFKRTGLASDYLTRYECVDSALLGGIQKQNRSLLRSAIFFVTTFLAIFSVSIIGTTGKTEIVDTPLTTLLIAESLLVPLVNMFLMFIVYYIYTNIRNHEYKLACEYFYDMLDILDEKVDLKNVFDGDVRQVGLISAVYDNETVEKLIEKSKKKQRILDSNEVRVGRTSFSPLKAGVIGGVEMTPTKENILKDDTKQTFGVSVDNAVTSNFKIKNEIHFVEVMNCVEVLLNRVENEKDKEKRQSLEREINTMIKALTEYKQKAKEKQTKRGSKNPSKR